MDNAQNCDSYINIPWTQTYRPYMHSVSRQAMLNEWNARQGGEPIQKQPIVPAI
jgi:hypothetical protein